MSTMQATKKFKCGGCKGYHPDLAAVKACCLSGAKASDYDQPTQTTFEAQRAAVRQSGPPATERQRAFLFSLIEERPMAADVENIHPDKVPTYTKAEASNAIKNLLGHPKENGTYGKPSTVAAAFKMPDVPEGHYAIPSETGNNDLDFFRIDKPTEGRWAGRTFVKRIVGGKPDFGVRGEAAVKVAERIVAAGVKEAALLYGQEIGRCCRCNRHLTDEASRAFGMGPDCRGMVGW